MESEFVESGFDPSDPVQVEWWVGMTDAQRRDWMRTARCGSRPLYTLGGVGIASEDSINAPKDAQGIKRAKRSPAKTARLRGHNPDEE